MRECGVVLLMAIASVPAIHQFGHHDWFIVTAAQRRDDLPIAVARLPCPKT